MAQVLTTEKTNLQAYLILVVGVMAASMGAIFIRLAQAQDVPSMLIAGGRLSVAVLVLTPMVFRSPAYISQMRGLSQRDLGLIGASGIFLALHFAAWVTSLEHTTVLISLVLVTTTPIWVALLEMLFLRARLSSLVLAGLMVAMMGGVIIGLAGEPDSAANGNQMLGGVLSLIGALAVAVYLVIGRSVRGRLSLTPYIWLVYGTAALILLFIVLINRIPLFGYDPVAYVWILLLGLVPQLIGHSAFNYALAYLPATYISVATQMEPVFGSIVAYFIFTEVPASGQIIGGIVIIAGVMLASIGQGKKSA